MIGICIVAKYRGATALYGKHQRFQLQKTIPVDLLCPVARTSVHKWPGVCLGTPRSDLSENGQITIETNGADKL
jgi:hypothetical protein